jgi:hypothetical protein
MNTEEIIKHYITLLACEQFAVTGSYALYRMGLVPSFSDLDITLYKPAPGIEDILTRLAKDNPAKTSSYGEGSFIFLHEGLKIDVFMVPQPLRVLQVDGFNITDAAEVIRAKKRIGRVKDAVQLFKLANSIMSDDCFKDWIGRTNIYGNTPIR